MLQKKRLKLRKEDTSGIPLSKVRNKQLTLKNRSILSFKNNLRYLSSGIPLACVASLLFMFGITFNPNSTFSSSVYAEEDYGIELLDNAPSAAATLTIGGAPLSGQTDVGLGSVGYRKHTVRITTNDVTGYTLSISGPTNLTGSTTVTGANNKTPSNMDNNTWGYYYGDNSSEEAVAYQSFTGSSQNLETNTSGSNTDKTSNLIFAAKFADTATAGHYTASVVLSLAATPKQVNTYSLAYDANGGSGAPTTQNCTTTAGGLNCNVTISSAKPTKTNYEFLGWSTNIAATTADDNYTSGKTITISANTTLYAVWKQLVWDGTTTPGFTSITNMQQMTSDICKSEPMGATKTLTDTRDNSTYTVTKLDDDRCWMTQNLRLTANSLTKNGHSTTIDSTDSDTNSYPMPTEDTIWSNSIGVSGQRVYYANNTTYGAYYTWCAATANSCADATNKDDIATQSICPKGWKLPTEAEYKTFFSSAGISNDSTGSSKIRGMPYNFPYTGHISNSALEDTSSAGYCLSSTALTSPHVNVLVIGSSYAHISNFTRYGGYPVRCIAAQ